MKEKGDRKQIIVMAIICIVAFAGLWIYSVYSHGGKTQKIKIDKLAQRYIIENYPELEGRVEKRYDGAYFNPSGRYQTDLTAEMSRWDGVWICHYKIDNDNYKLFYLMFNRKGDKLLFDGYKDNYLKCGALMRQLYYEYYYNIHDLFKADKNRAVKNKTNTDYHEAVVHPVFNITDSETGKSYSAENDYTEKYPGPVLEIDKKYDVNEFAKDFCLLQFQYRGIDREKRDIKEIATNIKDFIVKNNIRFNRINITFDTFYGLYGIPAQEFLNSDIDALIDENAMSMVEMREKLQKENAQ